MSYPTDYLTLLEDLEKGYARFAELEKEAASTLQQLQAQKQSIAELATLLREVQAASGTLQDFRAFAKDCQPFLTSLQQSNAAVAQARAAMPELKQQMQLVEQVQAANTSGTLGALRAFVTEAKPILTELKSALTDLASLRSSTAEIKDFIGIAQQFRALKSSGEIEELRSVTATVQPMLTQLQAAKPELAVAQAATPSLRQQLEVISQATQLKASGLLDEAQAVAKQFGPYIELLDRNRALITAGFAVSHRARELKSPIPIRDGKAPGEEIVFQIFEEVFMEFCWIPSPSDKEQIRRSYSSPLHVWHIDTCQLWFPNGKTSSGVQGGFWLSKHPCTQRQWEQVMGTNPSKFKGPNRPVESISRRDVQRFCFQLPEPHGWNYGLPTYLEWQFAACCAQVYPKHGIRRWPTGTQTTEPLTLVKNETSNVGEFEGTANDWGLADVLGNVKLRVREEDRIVGSSYCSPGEILAVHNVPPELISPEIGFRLGVFPDYRRSQLLP